MLVKVGYKELFKISMILFLYWFDQTQAITETLYVYLDLVSWIFCVDAL